MPDETTAAVPAPASAPRSRWRRWRVGWCVLAAVFVALGYATWRQYDFRQAIKEAKALGWEWTYDDPIEAIRGNWKALFQKKTWLSRNRNLLIVPSAEFPRHFRLVHRLAPKKLTFVMRGESDLSLLKGLTGVRELHLEGCQELRELGALKDIAGLQVLFLRSCRSLRNLDSLPEFLELQSLNLRACVELRSIAAIGKLQRLRNLNIMSCGRLANFAGIADLTSLRALDINDCSQLSNLDTLKGMHSLRTLSVTWCSCLSDISAIEDLSDLQRLTLVKCCQLLHPDALKKLTGLRWLIVYSCGFPKGSIAAMRAVLPKAKILSAGD